MSSKVSASSLSSSSAPSKLMRSPRCSCEVHRAAAVTVWSGSKIRRPVPHPQHAGHNRWLSNCRARRRPGRLAIEERGPNWGSGGQASTANLLTRMLTTGLDEVGCARNRGPPGRSLGRRRSAWTAADDPRLTRNALLASTSCKHPGKHPGSCRGKPFLDQCDVLWQQ